MLRPFEIHEPTTVAEASRLLRRYGDDAAVYAGGTELIPVMKDGLAHYRHLVNIKTIPGLDAITVEGDAVSIGALATHYQIERSPLVNARAPVLAHVAAGVANLRVRNAGTLGGNLCFAEPHSDPAALLVARGATLVVARDGAERRVAADAFFTGILQTVREPDEVLIRVEVLSFGQGAGAAYARFATHERPTAGVAAVLTITDGIITDARAAVGSVGPIPARVREAEAALIGGRPDDDLFTVAAETAGRSVEILDDLYGSIEYKRHIVTVLAVQALRDAAGAAGAHVQ
ncbi:MAG: FAD binding domain-containing protein [Armatimonadota bacterium]